MEGVKRRLLAQIHLRSSLTALLFLFFLGKDAFIFILIIKNYMAKLAGVGMRYITTPLLGNILKLGNKITEARDFINSNYGEAVVCGVTHPERTMISVYIGEKQPGSLKQPIKKYFSIVDPLLYPFEYVHPGSDFHLIEETLHEKGKRMKKETQNPFCRKIRC